MDEPIFSLEGIIREKDEIKDFEGPLTVILMLLSKNKIEIRDIKISDILEQYLEYLAQMKTLDLEITSDFVRMAAYLLYIKTKMMLSGDEEVSELELLMESLEQLKAKDVLTAVKEVGPELLEAFKIGALYCVKGPEPLPASSTEYNYSHEPADLLKALKRVYTSPEKVSVTDTLSTAIPGKIVYSVKNKSRQILSRLRLRDIPLNELYSECRTKSEIVATFVSVLELCSIGSVVVSYCKNGEGYELSFTGGDPDDIIDLIEE